MDLVSEIINELKKAGDNERAGNYAWFFQVRPGGYGEGDKFYGVKVPVERKIAKRFFHKATITDCAELLDGKYHEERQTALFILVAKYKKTKDGTEKKKIYNLYVKKVKSLNNWDLIDLSAWCIMGAWLYDKNDERIILFDYAKSNNLWKKRIAIIATGYFIKQKDFADTLKISEMLLHDKHDLIHKAVGWMLREVGNRDRGEEEKFLKKHYKEMPRTMLRYAIEKFPEPLRQKYLKSRI